MNRIERIRKAIEESAARSAWKRGVKAYALELFESIEWHVSENLTDPDTVLDLQHLDTVLLNGAGDWRDFSYGGCSLINNFDIAMRLCTPSELDRNDYGRLDPNGRETWLDTQARALYQAEMLIRDAIRATA